MGPFTVTQVVNPVAYKLHTPSTLGVHPIFHVSLLRPFVARKDRYGRELPPNIPTLVDGFEEWIVEAILDHRPLKGDNVKTKSYLVLYEGLDRSYEDWVPYANLQNSETLLAEYWKNMLPHKKALIYK